MCYADNDDYTAYGYITYGDQDAKVNLSVMKVLSQAGDVLGAMVNGVFFPREGCSWSVV